MYLDIFCDALAAGSLSSVVHVTYHIQFLYSVKCFVALYAVYFCSHMYKSLILLKDSMIFKLLLHKHEQILVCNFTV